MDAVHEPSMEAILVSMQQIISGHRGGPRGKKADARATAQRNPVLARRSADYSPLVRSAHDHDRHTPAPESDWDAHRVVGEHTNTVPAKNACTLEDLVVERLRPMFKSWLDGRLPALVEQLVQEEIQRVSSSEWRPQSIHMSQLEAQKGEQVSVARADFPRNNAQPTDDYRSGHLPLSQVETYTELLSAEFERSRERMMKELETHGSTLIEAFSKQGRSIAIALDTSVRDRLDTFSARTRSIVEALDRTKAVIAELPKTVDHLGEMYTELLSDEFDRSRERMMKESETQGSRLIEAFSRQGRSIAIALDSSVRDRLDTFSAQTRSIVEVLDRTKAVIAELPKTVDRLGEMNRSIQSAVAHLSEPLATAETALSRPAFTPEGAPQAATGGEMASVDAIIPASNQVAPSSTKTKAIPQKHSGERPELYAGDELQGSVDQVGVAANKVDLHTIIEQLETIDKLWKTGASSGEDLTFLAAEQASISSLRPRPASEHLFTDPVAAEPPASEGVERSGECVSLPARADDKVSKGTQSVSLASKRHTQKDREIGDSWVKELLRRASSSGGCHIFAVFCVAAAVTWWL